jgi:hypothetical protein
LSRNNEFDYESNIQYINASSAIQLTQLINMLNESNAQFALENLARALESNEFNYAAHNEDLLSILEYAQQNGQQEGA